MNVEKIENVFTFSSVFSFSELTVIDHTNSHKLEKEFDKLEAYLFKNIAAVSSVILTFVMFVNGKLFLNSLKVLFINFKK